LKVDVIRALGQTEGLFVEFFSLGEILVYGTVIMTCDCIVEIDSCMSSSQ
jgi:hypothetical protein